MKSKLRKEFEAFQKETSKQIYLLQNPEKFKFGEKVSIYYSDGTWAGDCIYKGRDKLTEEYNHYRWNTAGQWCFEFRCFIEDGNVITTWNEYGIRKLRKDAK